MRGSFLGLITSNGPLLTTNWQKLSVRGMSDAPALDSSPSVSTRSTSFSTPPSNLYTAVQRWATRAFKKSGLHAVRLHSARTQVVVVALKSCKMLPVSAQRQCSGPHDLHMHMHTMLLVLNSRSVFVKNVFQSAERHQEGWQCSCNVQAQGCRVSVNGTSGVLSAALRLVSFQVPLTTLPQEFLTISPFQVPVMFRLSEDSSSSSTPSSRSPAKKALAAWPAMAAVPLAAPRSRLTVPARLSENSACCSSRMVALTGKPPGGFTNTAFHKPYSWPAFMVWAVGQATNGDAGTGLA